MDDTDRFNLIKRNLVEVVTEGELKKKIETGNRIKGYIGYEPSGLIHIGWLVWMFKVKDLVDAGVEFTVLEATWHAYINDKLGGDMRLIRESATLTREIMGALGIPVDKIAFMDAEKLASDKDYWGLVIRVSKNASLSRIKRALTIMGRKASEADIDASKLIYPAMQVADIIYMDLDLALGGMDQRKAHMLQRDLAEKLGVKKVIALHTPLITGLQGTGRMDTTADIDDVYVDIKMSKSRPETTILVHEPPEAIEAKLRKAYCPPRQVEYNPVIEINRYILFQQPGFKLEVERPRKYGGPVTYTSYKDLEDDYRRGELHPLDLKKATSKALAELLKPVRDKIERRKELIEAIEEIKSRITR